MFRQFVLLGVPVLSRDSTANAHWWGRGARSGTEHTSACAAIAAAAYISTASCVGCDQSCKACCQGASGLTVTTCSSAWSELLPVRHWTKSAAFGHVGTALLWTLQTQDTSTSLNVQLGDSMWQHSRLGLTPDSFLGQQALKCGLAWCGPSQNLQEALQLKAC